MAGSVDLRELEALTAVPGLDRGIANLQVQGKGNLTAFSIDGEGKVDGGGYRIPEVRVSGVNASTNIHITQDEIALTALKARLATGGSAEGELHLLNWLAPKVLVAASSPASSRETKKTEEKKTAVASVAKQIENLRCACHGRDRNHSRTGARDHVAQHSRNNNSSRLPRSRL